MMSMMTIDSKREYSGLWMNGSIKSDLHRRHKSVTRATLFLSMTCIVTIRNSVAYSSGERRKIASSSNHHHHHHLITTSGLKVSRSQYEQAQKSPSMNHRRKHSSATGTLFCRRIVVTALQLLPLRWLHVVDDDASNADCSHCEARVLTDWKIIATWRGDDSIFFAVVSSSSCCCHPCESSVPLDDARQMRRIFICKIS